MLKEFLKEHFFRLTHDPNSIEGLKHRLERLRKLGFSEDNQAIIYLKTMIKMKESEVSS